MKRTARKLARSWKRNRSNAQQCLVVFSPSLVDPTLQMEQEKSPEYSVHTGTQARVSFQPSPMKRSEHLTCQNVSTGPVGTNLLGQHVTFFSKDKTFRPRKRFEPGTQRFELYKKAQASLKSGLDLRKVVQLPDGENINDWIAVHVVDFFNRINLIYGTVSEFCTERTCPIMSGGLRYEYRWQDGDQYRRPTKLPALKYMNLLMDWIETNINNEDIFPTRVGVPFPKNFQQVCKKILSRLFRVFVHVYIHHFDSVCSMGAEAHINTCYKHYYYFISEFSLIEHSELEPLREMTEKICN
ncbi:hypothetical protein DPEC_G00273670 [Dallia pectoralis]|uniref:Uncharacterized protein n=1 Tax=Dallia pectoralis TaxID=75939 RepID=A0ACC2FQP6_DALPE|nr:hypothetical protein DPEC_G00273670 [Dallia pectoralis]